MLALRRGDGIATPLRISFDREMRGFFGKAIPGMVASAGPQLLIVAGAIIASSSPSAVSWLYFANRLIELPLGIVGVAMGTVLVPELTRALRADDRAVDRARGVARAGTRGRTGAAGDARADRAERADRAYAVRARRVHRGRHRGNCPCADVAGARPAGACSGQGAVAGVLCARGHHDAAVGGAEGNGRRDRRGLRARPGVRGWRYCRGHRARSLEQRAVADPAWRRELRFSIDAEARRRLPRIVLAALAMGGLLWLAAHVVLAAGANAHGLVQARFLLRC